MRSLCTHQANRAVSEIKAAVGHHVVDAHVATNGTIDIDVCSTIRPRISGRVLTPASRRRFVRSAIDQIMIYATE
jgi:hypothetical protein